MVFRSASVLADGAYTITTTDGAGCAGHHDHHLVSGSLFLDFVQHGSELHRVQRCHAFTATAAGGTGVVTFEVPEVAVMIDFEGSVEYDQADLPSGTYTFTLTDENGCTLSDVLEIEEPDGLAVTYAVTELCPCWRLQRPPPRQH